MSTIHILYGACNTYYCFKDQIKYVGNTVFYKIENKKYNKIIPIIQWNNNTKEYNKKYNTIDYNKIEIYNKL